jgi:hypothetical protein
MLVVTFALLMSACDTSFQPFAESEHHFTVMGYLDSDADTQFVRIVSLRQVIDRSLPLPIDATVQTTDLVTGEQVAWHDMLIQFDDSTYGHVFWAAFQPQPEHRYRIDVHRSDGAITSAETTLPPKPDVEATYTVENRGAFFQPLIWPGVPNVIDVDVYYSVSGDAIAPPDPSPSTATEVVIRYKDDDRGSLQGNDWWTEFQLSEDYSLVTQALRDHGRRADRITLHLLTMRIAVPSADWHPPDGLWDPEVLVQPGTFSNVINGFGFWGSVTRATAEHRLDKGALEFFNYFEPS